MVKRMAEAGCCTVFLGLESGEAKILTDLGKRSTPAVTRDAIALLNNAGIEAYGSFMFGAMNETENDILQTIDFSKKLNLSFAQFSVLTPMPGTHLYDEVRDKITDKNWDNYDGLHNVFTLNHVPKKKVEKFVYKAYASFYLQPRVLFMLLKSLSLRNGLRLMSALAGFLIHNIKKVF